MRDRTFAFGSYDDLADEYYDAQRHPTCANFRDGSVSLFESWFSTEVEDESQWDIGAGESVLAEVIASRGGVLDRMTALDSSPSMLDYSRRWKAFGVRFAVGNATRIPARMSSASLVAASLGDPFNSEAFWAEAARILRPDGVCIFTTPSYEWAEAFRNGGTTDYAEFELSNGRLVLIPSVIHSTDEQIRRIEQFGLRVDDVAHVTRADLEERRTLSPKLSVLPDDNAAVVRGYRVVRT